MKQTGTTAYALAKATGLHQTSVANWKSGTNMPRAEALEKIALYFGTSVDELIREKEGAQHPAEYAQAADE